MSVCGNGTIEPGEECEGSDFGGLDCQSYGLVGGTLLCNDYCHVSATSCTPPESCGDGKDNDGDSLIDCDDNDCLLAVECADSCASPTLGTIPGTIKLTTVGRPSSHTASCTGVSGNETMLEFTSPTTGKLTITLSAPGPQSFSVSVRSVCDDDASEIACVSIPASASGHQGKLVFDAVQGTTYVVMVDSVGSTPGALSLDIWPLIQELVCNDLADNDGDGFVDCDDVSGCQNGIFCSGGTAPVGKLCSFTFECGSNKGDPLCLTDAMGFPGGFCSEFCDLTAPDCASGAVCAQLGISKNGVCLSGCAIDADCRPGYACVDRGFASTVCMALPETSCNDNLDNDGNGLRDCEDPTCQALPDCAPGVKSTGQPCSLDNECSSTSNDPLCLSTVNFKWPGGYCSEFCALGANDCAPGAACVNWFNFPSGHGACLDVCSTVADCGAGYSCVDLGSAQKFCIFL